MRWEVWRNTRVRAIRYPLMREALAESSAWRVFRFFCLASSNEATVFVTSFTISSTRARSAATSSNLRNASFLRALYFVTPARFLRKVCGRSSVRSESDGLDHLSARSPEDERVRACMPVSMNSSTMSRRRHHALYSADIPGLTGAGTLPPRDRHFLIFGRENPDFVVLDGDRNLQQTCRAACAMRVQALKMTFSITSERSVPACAARQDPSVWRQRRSTYRSRSGRR